MILQYSYMLQGKGKRTKCKAGDNQPAYFKWKKERKK